MSWQRGGLLMGLVFFAAVLLSKPVGISTEFVVVGGLIWDAFSPTLIDGAASTNAYLASSKGAIAKDIANPLAAYGLYFMVATIVGGLVSSLLRRRRGAGHDVTTDQDAPAASTGGYVPTVWAERFGTSRARRLLATFVGGIVVLYGARLAGGCTSGHMMSGMMQTSVSGYLFALGAFGAAVPLSLALYRTRKA